MGQQEIVVRVESEGLIVVESGTFKGNLEDGQFLPRKMPEEIRMRPAVKALNALDIVSTARQEKLGEGSNIPRPSVPAKAHENCPFCFFT